MPKRAEQCGGEHFTARGEITAAQGTRDGGLLRRPLLPPHQKRQSGSSKTQQKRSATMGFSETGATPFMRIVWAGASPANVANRYKCCAKRILAAALPPGTVKAKVRHVRSPERQFRNPL